MRTPKGRSKRGVEQRLGSSMRGFRVGLDIGGTFTDFVLLNDTTGELRLHKVLTTTPDPAEGALRGLVDLCRLAGVGVSDLSTLVHGTTLVTNAIIERTGAPTALDRKSTRLNSSHSQISHAVFCLKQINQ